MIRLERAFVAPAGEQIDVPTEFRLGLQGLVSEESIKFQSLSDWPRGLPPLDLVVIQLSGPSQSSNDVSRVEENSVTFGESKWVWMDGRVIPWQSATTHVSSHALHYGSGVFEGIRCYETSEGPAVFRLHAHLDRLYASAEIYGIKIPYSREELANGVEEIVRLNNFRSCYIRPICYLGSGSLGVHPGENPVEVVILAWPWAPYLGADGLKNGVNVTISPWRKFDSRMLPTTAKACGQYLNSILAVRDAVSRGFAEALLLDAEGHLTEGSGENLFIVRDGRLLTNDERHSILLGITREAVLTIAADLGYQVEVRALDPEDLLAAEEAFLTGTAAEVTPIREVDGTVIGKGAPGVITEEIQQAFFAATSGRDQRYREWLHLIDSKTGDVIDWTLQTVS